MNQSGSARALVVGLVVVAVGLSLLLLQRTDGDADRGAHPGTSLDTALPGPGASGFRDEGATPGQAQPLVSTLPAVTAPGTVAAHGSVVPDDLLVIGRVLWNGAPLADVDVILHDHEGSDLEYVTTEEDGSFEIRWPSALLPGWSVATDPAPVPWQGGELYLTPALAGPFLGHQRGDPPLEVELLPGFAPVIAGRVFERATGLPIEGAELGVACVLPAWSFDTADAVSDENGSYLLELEDLPLQQLVVWCVADGFMAKAWGPQDVTAPTQPGEGFHVDFALDRAEPWRGRVVDARSGAPIPDAVITISSDLPIFADWSDFEMTDDDGEFELELDQIPAQVAWLHVSADGYGAAALRGVQPGRMLDIRLHGPLVLSGVVVDHVTGEPIEGADITVAFDGDLPEYAEALYDEASTDDEGHFELLLELAPADSAHVLVESVGYEPFAAPLGALMQPAAGGTLSISVRLFPEVP